MVTNTTFDRVEHDHRHAGVSAAAPEGKTDADIVGFGIRVPGEDPALDLGTFFLSVVRRSDTEMDVSTTPLSVHVRMAPPIMSKRQQITRSQSSLALEEGQEQAKEESKTDDRSESAGQEPIAVDGVVASQTDSVEGNSEQDAIQESKSHVESVAGSSNSVVQHGDESSAVGGMVTSPPREDDDPASSGTNPADNGEDLPGSVAEPTGSAQTTSTSKKKRKRRRKK